MGRTNQHNWPTPDEGDTDYETTFQNFFSQVDSDVEIRDTDANKGNYTPEDSALFRATDTGTVYQGDGSSWNKIDLGVNSLDTESLVDANDGQAWETLREAGWETGDYVPMVVFPYTQSTVSTSSTTFTTVGDGRTNRFNLPTGLIDGPSDVYISFGGEITTDNGVVRLCEVNKFGATVQDYPSVEIDTGSGQDGLSQSPRIAVSDLNLQDVTEGLALRYKSHDGDAFFTRGLSFYVESKV